MVREYISAGKAYNSYSPVLPKPSKIEMISKGEKVLSIVEAASYMGVSRQTISRWQAGGYLSEGNRFSQEDLDQLGHYNLKTAAELLQTSRTRIYQFILEGDLPDKPRWRLDELQEVAPKIRRVHHKTEKALDLSPWAALMGKVPDIKIAKEAGCCIKTVQLWRAKRGIEATRPRGY